MFVKEIGEYRALAVGDRCLRELRYYAYTHQQRIAVIDNILVICSHIILFVKTVVCQMKRNTLSKLIRHPKNNEVPTRHSLSETGVFQQLPKAHIIVHQMQQHWQHVLLADT